MRCFIGFFVPEHARSGVLALQKRLQRLPMDAKFVEPENLHVSLSFIGEADDSAVAEIEAKLQDVAAGCSRFRAVADTMKLIPNESRVRVIALDVRDASGELGGLFEGIMHDIGGDAKPPHLTLCRVRGVSDARTVYEKTRCMKFDAIEFDVGEVVLVKSELGRDGPAYSVVKSFELK
jgi:2'-5' RNA ligase